MKYIKIAFTLAALALLNIHIGATNLKPFVIPELKEWKGSNGELTITKNSRIVYNVKHTELKKIAEELASDWNTMFNQTLTIATDGARNGDIEIIIKPDKKLNKEGYSIAIGSRITLTAPTKIGAYWGTKTILQIAEQSQNRTFPKGTIKDFPDYELRGFMIDCARKYIPLSYLDDLVKIMSYYKLNTLQIHLNDNGFKQFYEHDWSKTYSAFRLESTTYPGLAAHDGFYTKEEFKEFQKRALKYGIEIIPEIDVPAHSLSFARYMPEIASVEFGEDHLDISKEATYKFLDALFKEYLEGDDPVFVGKKVHIGTDEYSNERPELSEQFRKFTDYYIRYVEQFGKQAYVWGALTHAQGTTPVKSENVIMSVWNNDFSDPETMIKDGYKIISIHDWDVYIVPGAPYYHDYLKDDKLYNEWTPAKFGKIKLTEKDPAIIGGMFAVWNDLVGNGISVKDIHHRLFSPLQVISSKMWYANPHSLTYEQFDKKRKALSEAPGVNQLGRIGTENSLVIDKKTIMPNSTIGIREVGYNYTINFDIIGSSEKKGTELFSSPDATFYLADPISGKIGFARDGYLNTFRYKIKDGEKANIQIEGTNTSTKLKVDGKLICDLNIQLKFYNSGKDSMKYVRTLVFPLEKSGDYKSKINNFKVYNFIKE